MQAQGLKHLDEDPRISFIDFLFDEGPGKDGNACVICLDGIPIHVEYYIWDLDREWMAQQIEQKIGIKMKLTNFGGGNGHEDAEIIIIDETTEEKQKQ